jgi:RimJ/RimL family protein N-acetyltransferase
MRRGRRVPAGHLRRTANFLTISRSDSASSDPVDEVHTERLSMRPLSEGDATLYCDLYGDPDTMRFVGPPLSRERAQRSFRKDLASRHRRPLERLFLVIVAKASKQAIGLGAFQGFDAHRRRGEAGIMLGRESRGRGFGKEGLSALVTYAFAIFPVEEVWVQHAVGNSNAKRMIISLGLSRNTDAAYDDGSGKLIWSAHRDSWCHGPAAAIIRLPNVRSSA